METQSVVLALDHSAPLHEHLDPTHHFSLRSVTVIETTLDAMNESTSRFGFVAFAETWNGRLAMLGFVIGLGTELLTGQGILTQIGLG